MRKKGKYLVAVLSAVCLGGILGVTLAFSTPVLWSYTLKKQSVFISFDASEIQYIICKIHKEKQLSENQCKLEPSSNSLVYQAVTRRASGGLQTLYFEVVAGDITKIVLFDEMTPEGPIGIWRVMSTVDKHSSEVSFRNGIVYELLLEEIDSSVEQPNQIKMSLVIESGFK